LLPSWNIFKSLSLPTDNLAKPPAAPPSGACIPLAFISVIVAAESVPGDCLACTYAESIRAIASAESILIA
jgi:hypothetical protein